ncbi:nucleoside hydrolase [Aquirufa sp.]|jgi:inosine-uridine nucleoside N-ribohydrolase|uniref:nucleoside hydrolase n=1 Tax=Aquirufa sp. TaxID=2676249 RepID=UPI003784261E
MKKLILFLLVSFSLAAQQRQKVIFDCDLGDDIDDAYALGYLLTLQDRYEILGITTCYGRTDDRAILANKFLAVTGETHIPVYVGKNTSNSSKRANWYADQFYWAKGSPLVKKSISATEFIRSQLKKYPGEVIIFSVGPVTNLAPLGTELQKAKAIYAMFGSFKIGYDGSTKIDAEWNVTCDIPSAKSFVQSGANIIYAGLDVTAMVKLSAENRLKLLMRQSPLTSIMQGLYVLWGQETPTLFDPVAIGMETNPELFTTEKVHVYVDDQGYTRLDPNKPANATIGTTIKSAEFIKILMHNYLYQNLN